MIVLMRSLIILLFIIIVIPAQSKSGVEGDSNLSAKEEFLASLNFQQGEIELPGHIASIKATDDFFYLSPKDTEKLLVEGWGNPPGNETLGMLVPQSTNPLSQNGWAIVMSYEEDGHVADDDADSINYDDLLKDMKESIHIGSKERVKEGYVSIELIGWAEEPYYDKISHKLYWAKEIKFGDDPVHTLNYNIRVLGRKGVLVLNAVAGMYQLDDIKNPMQAVLEITDFKEGSRYADFDPSIDKVAAYGIGALVAGKLAAKAGIFAKLGALLLAFKKVIIPILIAIGAFLSRIFKGRKDKNKIIG